MLRAMLISLPRRFCPFTSPPTRSPKPVLPGLISRALLPLVFVALALAVSAATAGGRVEGSVTDPSGAKLAGARVLLRDATGLIAYQARSDDEGQFAIGDVAAGRY